MGIVTMCSIAGNSLVFVVICWNHSLSKPLNLFLFNLAIADIGISCTCIPYAVGQVMFMTNVSTFKIFRNYASCLKAKLKMCFITFVSYFRSMKVAFTLISFQVWTSCQ